MQQEETDAQPEAMDFTLLALNGKIIHDSLEKEFQGFAPCADLFCVV